MISACLAGLNVRYDGTNRLIVNEELQELIDNKTAVIVCPEVLAGLKSPRKPSEIHGTGGGCGVLCGAAKVMSEDGNDLTDLFIKGAEKTAESAVKHGCTIALLKENSPSCGIKYIYDGTFSGKKLDGKGVTAELLDKTGIKLFNEYELDEALRYIKN